MNLYKVIFRHCAPKGSDSGIKALVLAENDEQVYEWIAKEPKIESGSLYNNWKQNELYTYDKEKDDFVDDNGKITDKGWYDDDHNPENHKDRMLRLCGDIQDDSVDYIDSYYGITTLGWELAEADVTSDYSELIEAGIVFEASE